MNRQGRSASSHDEAWGFLRYQLKADLCLVQEALPPDDLASVFRPIGAKPYNWGSAVVVLRPDLTLRARRRVPLEQSLFAAVAEDELPDSHPGASAVADVQIDGRHLFTAVSLYAQWEMMPGGKAMYAGPRLHRMLSDLTGILVQAPRKPVMVAGDLNVTSQGARRVDNEASAAFQRLRAWGLLDCLTHTRDSRPRLTGCECADGDACAHVQTFRTGTQLDYAFVSSMILGALRSCNVEATAAAWERSDHSPILIELDDHALLRLSGQAANGSFAADGGGCDRDAAAPEAVS